MQCVRFQNPNVVPKLHPLHQRLWATTIEYLTLPNATGNPGERDQVYPTDSNLKVYWSFSELQIKTQHDAAEAVVVSASISTARHSCRQPDSGYVFLVVNLRHELAP